MQAMPGRAILNFQSNHERLPALLLIVVAVAATGWTLWRFVPAWLDDGGRGADVADASPDPRGRSAAGADLSEFPLFGSPAASGGDGAFTVNAPVTDLALTLRGTVAAPDPEEALAIVADDQGMEKSYRVGAELPGGATLKEVHPDRAIIRYQGRLESLPLRKPEQGPKGRVAGGGDRSSRAPTPRQSPADLQRAREALMSDPAALARNISLQPVQENGEIIGMRVSSGISATLMGQLGIRPTDVITEVNGVTLDSPERAQQIMDALPGADRLNVTLRRDGQSRQVTVPLDR